MSILQCPGCGQIVDTDEDEMEVGVLTDEVVCIRCAMAEEEELMKSERDPINGGEE